MIRLRQLPYIVGLILVGVAGGIAVDAAPRMKAIEKPAADPSPVPATNAMAVVTVHPVLTEWQDAIETSGVIFLRVHLADPIRANPLALSDLRLPG
jgi:hypothetical protein